MAATVTREDIDEAHRALEAEDTRPDGAADDPAGGVQDGLFDQVIEDEALEAALDEREKRKQRKKKATAEFKEKHDVVKAKLDFHDLPDGSIVRCGRHRVKITRTAPRSVAFETGGSRRVTISLLDPEA